MRKLAILREENESPCPYGLPIDAGCRTVGSEIYHMLPSAMFPEDISDEEKEKIFKANREVWETRLEDEKCPYAARLWDKEEEKPTIVECNFDENSAGIDEKGVLSGSPLSYRMFPNSPFAGLYTFPLGFPGDMPGSRPSYFGTQSFGSVGINEHSKQNDTQGFPMSLAKSAQLVDLDGESVPRDELAADDYDHVSIEVESEPSDDMDGISKEVTIQVDDEEPEVFEFTVPNIPGAESQEDFEPEIEVEEPEDVEVEDDPWKWNLKSFLPWLQGKVNGVPKHTGKDLSGLERAIAYMDRLIAEIKKATRQDLHGELDCNAVEDARDQILDGLGRLNKRHELVSGSKSKSKKKKKADFEMELVKEGSKATGINVNVPLFISYIARVCMNSMQSAGHDIEVTFDKLKKKFKLTEREQMEVLTLLDAMGYDMNRDRGFLLDEDIDTTSSDNFDFSANFRQ